MEELNNLEHNSDGSNEKLHLSDVSCSVCGGQDILLEQKEGRGLPPKGWVRKMGDTEEYLGVELGIYGLVKVVVKLGVVIHSAVKLVETFNLKTYIKIMKNYLLTDFNTERWKGINLESVKTQVEKLNEKTNKIGCLFGEIGNPTNFDISLSRASHSIKNLTFNDGKVYGDVEFLDNGNGKQADNFINNMNC